MSSSSREVILFDDTENENASDYMVQPTSEALQLDSIDINSGSSGGASALSEDINRVRAGKRRGSNPKPSKKKRGGEGSEGSYDHHHYNTTKKPRLIWTAELHENFLKAHDTYIEKPVPKLILEYMRKSGFPYITRENVASHLQKHRLHLKKLESNFKPSSPTSSPQTYRYNSKLRSSSSSKSEPITCPNAHDHLPVVIHSQHDTWENQPMDNVHLLEFDQTYGLFDQNMMQAFDQPEPTLGEMPYPQAPQPQPIGQPSLNGALDFAIMVNLFGGQNYLSNQFPNFNSNNDHFHANDHFNNPPDYVPNFDDLSGSYFPHDCTMDFENLQIDCEKNMYGLGAQSYSDALEFGYPIKQNEEFGQVVQTMFYPSNNHPTEASMLPQTSANPWEEQGKNLGKEKEKEKDSI